MAGTRSHRTRAGKPRRMRTGVPGPPPAPCRAAPDRWMCRWHTAAKRYMEPVSGRRKLPSTRLPDTPSTQLYASSRHSATGAVQARLRQACCSPARCRTRGMALQDGGLERVELGDRSGQRRLHGEQPRPLGESWMRLLLGERACCCCEVPAGHGCQSPGSYERYGGAASVHMGEASVGSSLRRAGPWPGGPRHRAPLAPGRPDECRDGGRCQWRPRARRMAGAGLSKVVWAQATWRSGRTRIQPCGAPSSVRSVLEGASWPSEPMCRIGIPST